MSDLGGVTDGTTTEPIDSPADDQESVNAKLDRVIAMLERSDGIRDRAARAQETFWALEGLRDRLADDTGEVMIVGAAGLPTGETFDWQESRSVSSIMEREWSGLADSLSALGHPIRLIILQRVANGIRSTAELAAIPELGTTGQLHHHLRLLVTAGWLSSTGRGHYTIPTPRVVPLLAILLGAVR